jgi:uncharacterized membrane protein
MMTMALRGFKAASLLWGLVLLLFVAASPAMAHKEHKKKPVQTEQVMAAPPARAITNADPNAVHAQMGETIEPKEDRSQMSMAGRLMDWLGRLHPMIVHFPIAFFPAALFTAIVGRRRPAFAAPVQFLVLAGGIIGPIAALVGWFDAGFDWATDDWLLQRHRWLGTGIGIGALGLAICAWRRPEANRGAGMIAGLTLVTMAIVVQGWFGGAMVHGVDHMNW